MAKQDPIKVLLLEDVPSDAELTCDALREAGLQVEIGAAKDEDSFQLGIESMQPDVILADFSLPRYDGLSALAMRRKLAPDTPFVFVTGSLGEENAVEMLRIGATDYVLKQNLSRLPLVVLRALAESDAARDQARMQRQLDDERRLLSAVLDTTGALILVLDEAGRITRTNPAAERILGRPAAEISGRDFWSLFAEDGERDDIQAEFRHLKQNSGQASWRTTLPGERTVLWSAGLLTARQGVQAEYAVLAGIDVTDQEKAEQQAYYLRHYDSVTGLPNRTLLQHRLGLLQQDSDGGIALVLVGIARLHDVRDSHGGDAANLLLREVARRLLAWQQAGDWLARVGDDSFALVLALNDEGELSSQVRRLLEQLRQPYRLEGRELFLTAYLGVAHIAPGSDPAASLQGAEAALHRAVLERGEGFHVYEPMISDEARERLVLEAELHAALHADGQLVLHYQPQVDMKSGRILGLEALVRWQHPRLGLLPPVKFIPLAEACGLIVTLGERVLDMACRQAVAWQQAGLPAVTVAVNLAAEQWSRANLVETVQEALLGSGLAPQWLELELTESDSMHDPSATIATMTQLRQMGVHMSIDDFGTGYCNLSYLKRFPVDKLKIDRSFVSDITTVPDDLAISRTVVAIAHQLRLEVVAEGVETEGQLALLSDAGCDLVQGYLFSRPVPPEACAALLSSHVALPVGGRVRLGDTVLLVGVGAEVAVACEAAGYRALAAHDTAQAFEMLAMHEAGVVVASEDLPLLAGIEFLNRVRDMYPGAVRMVLPAQADAPHDHAHRVLPADAGPERWVAELAAAFAQYHGASEGAQGKA